MPREYESIYNKLYDDTFHENVNDTPRAAVAGELDAKILNFCNQHGFDRHDVVEEIKNNRMLAACFAKNPNRQKFHEITAGRYIRSIDGVHEFRDSNEEKLLFMNGAVVNESTVRDSGGVSNVKTIDFRWKYGNYTFYAYHKYTKESGGSQDNQYKDMQSFIEQANKSTATRTFFIAIADGPYYEGRNGQANKTRMSRLIQLSNNQTVFSCNIGQVECLMRRLCADE